MSQLCSIPHDTPVTPHTLEAYGQYSVYDRNDEKQSAFLGTGFVMGLGGLGMADSMSSYYHLFSFG